MRDVRFVEVALTVTTRQLHVEGDHGVQVVVSNHDQINLAAELIDHPRKSTVKGGAK